MKTKEYAEYLRTKSVSEKDIAEQTQAVCAFETWLAEHDAKFETAGKTEVRQYAGHLVET